jgi:hypothetical protein
MAALCWDWTYKGLQQGSVLSSTFILTLHSRTKIQNYQNCKLLEYADDVAVSRHSSIGVSEVEKSIQIIQVYLKESVLETAPNKCQLCIFDMKRTADEEWEITVEGQKVTSVKSIKFLGLRLKCNLDWEDEFTAIVRKCECGDGLQTEEHICWDCKLYEEQRATMMAILSENRKKEYPKSVTELLRLEEKRFVQGVSYSINKIPIFI